MRPREGKEGKRHERHREGTDIGGRGQGGGRIALRGRKEGGRKVKEMERKVR